jgi:hypothetical protein
VGRRCFLQRELSDNTPGPRPNRQRGGCRGACSQSLAKHQRWPVGGWRLLLGEGGSAAHRPRWGRTAVGAYAEVGHWYANPALTVVVRSDHLEPDLSGGRVREGAIADAAEGGSIACLRIAYASGTPAAPERPGRLSTPRKPRFRTRCRRGRDPPRARPSSASSSATPAQASLLLAKTRALVIGVSAAVGRGTPLSAAAHLPGGVNRPRSFSIWAVWPLCQEGERLRPRGTSIRVQNLVLAVARSPSSDLPGRRASVGECGGRGCKLISFRW